MPALEPGGNRGGIGGGIGGHPPGTCSTPAAEVRQHSEPQFATQAPAASTREASELEARTLEALLKTLAGLTDGTVADRGTKKPGRRTAAQPGATEPLQTLSVFREGLKQLLTEAQPPRSSAIGDELIALIKRGTPEHLPLRFGLALDALDRTGVKETRRGGLQLVLLMFFAGEPGSQQADMLRAAIAALGLNGNSGVVEPAARQHALETAQILLGQLLADLQGPSLHDALLACTEFSWWHQAVALDQMPSARKARGAGRSRLAARGGAISTGLLRMMETIHGAMRKSLPDTRLLCLERLLLQMISLPAPHFSDQHASAFFQQWMREAALLKPARLNQLMLKIVWPLMFMPEATKSMEAISTLLSAVHEELPQLPFSMRHLSASATDVSLTQWQQRLHHERLAHLTPFLDVVINYLEHYPVQSNIGPMQAAAGQLAATIETVDGEWAAQKRMQLHAIRQRTAEAANTPDAARSLRDCTQS